MNYTKERGPKISHFWSPKESSYGLRKKKRERKKRKEEETKKKVWILVWNLYRNAMILYGNYLDMDC